MPRTKGEVPRTLSHLSSQIFFAEALDKTNSTYVDVHPWPTIFECRSKRSCS